MIPANTFNGNLVAPERRCPTDTVRRWHLCKSLRNVVLYMHTGLTAVTMIDISVRSNFGHLHLFLDKQKQELLSSASPFDYLIVVLHPQRTTTLAHLLKRRILIALVAPLGILPHNVQHSPGVSISSANCDYFLKVSKNACETLRERPFPSSFICSLVSQYHKYSRCNRHREQDRIRQATRQSNQRVHNLRRRLGP